MKLLSVALLRQLSDDCAGEIDNLLRNGLTTANMDEPQNALNLSIIASNCGVSTDVIRRFVETQAFLNGLVGSCQTSDEFVQLIGYFGYLLQQIQLRQSNFEALMQETVDVGG